MGIKEINNDELRLSKKYWAKKLEGVSEKNKLPYSYEGNQFDFDEFGLKKLELQNEVYEKIKDITGNSNHGIYILLVSTVNLLLSKYSGKDDVLIGSPLLKSEGEMNSKGDILPLRSIIKGEITFKELINEVKETFIDANQNNNLSIYEIAELLNFECKHQEYPLVNTIVSLESIHDTAYLKEKKSPLNFCFSSGEKGLQCEIVFNRALFSEIMIVKMFEVFQRYLWSLLEDPYSVLAHVERELIFESESRFQQNKTLSMIFEERVRDNPNGIAVKYNSTEITYMELNNKVNQLAKALRKLGVGKNSIIGVLMDRSEKMIIAIMGIIKAGGAYLPIDPKYPDKRIEYIVQNSKTGVLVTETDNIGDISFKGDLVNLNKLEEECQENLEIINEPDDLAYVIYTSGTTGNPKGVMVEHKSVINLVQALNEEIYKNYQGQMKVALIAPFIFDASVQQIFASLLLGHTLDIVLEPVKKDGNKLFEYYVNNSIEISDGTPMHLKMLSNSIHSFSEELSLKHFIIGGDKLELNVVKKFYEKFKGKKPRITNVYGPTECCVDSTAFSIDAERIENFTSIPIGKPLMNFGIHILNEDMREVPVGGVGEIYISGPGVARGYLNNEELTVDKFIKQGEESPILYKTGDYARFHGDGNIDFIGRLDHQVKVRGYRVELGEIENNILKHELVNDVVVVAREENRDSMDSESYICAYYEAYEEIEEEDFREFLRELVPEYMIPSYFLKIDTFPETKSGKVDRKALPDPREFINEGYEEPQDGVKKKLLSIWREILNIDNIGVDSDFFELGGHSLKATILVNKVYKEFNIELPLGEIFTRPTINEIAEYIEIAESEKFNSIEVAPKKDYYSVSAAQKRMYVQNFSEGIGTSYNTPIALEIEGDIHKEKFENAIYGLIRRHESLRTSFKIVKGETVQIINDEVQFEIDYKEMDNCDIEEEMNSFVRKFDLSKAPLFRVSLLKYQEKRYLLMFDLHHIIVDGMSTAILIKEFTQLYEGEELQPLRIQYKDYSEWQKKVLDSDKMEKEREYWLQRYKDEIVQLNLPTDYPRGTEQSFEGDAILFEIDRDTTKNLKKLANERGSTPYIVLMAVYNILLSKYSKKEDIVVGSAIAGRNHQDLSNVMGMFVNMLAMRNYPKKDLTFGQFLEEVKKNAFDAFENQNYQFDMLVQDVCKEKDPMVNPIYDVMFTFQNIDIPMFEIKGATVKINDYRNKVSHADLNLMANEIDEKIVCELEYCTSLYNRKTIERFGKHFVNIIDKIIQNRDIKLSEIEIIDDQKRKEFVYEKNQTRCDYPQNKAIHELFEEQVDKTPEDIALEFEDEEMTYRELNDRANRLALVLREKGVSQNTIVALMMERSFEIIIGILGVLKAGGAYLPIDLDYPKERKDFMLKDSEVKVIITRNEECKGLDFNGEIINVDDMSLGQEIAREYSSISSSSDLAYVIFTSGSTGKPKGAMIEHKGLVNYICWARKTYIGEEKFDFPLYSSISFDLTVTSIFTPLISGNKIVIYGKNDKGMLIHKVVEDNKVDIVKLTPTHMKMLEDRDLSGSRIKKLIVGGEELKTQLARNICNAKEGELEIYNEYGPTEAVVGCMVHRFDINSDDESVPIGIPGDNVKIYLLDEDLKPVPQGIIGEIYISGDGLARGYLNREDMTAERFIINPFEGGMRMYKTGDLAKWDDEGKIKFLGRIDEQVKIRGYRIELGEIESLLTKQDGITNAVVLAKEESNGNKCLCAYIKAEESLDVGEVKENLSIMLPDYMIPSFFVVMDELPLTKNGKLDKQLLPDPKEEIDNSVDIEGARDNIEKKLLDIWKEVLDIKTIGINSDFFENGGHSLKATALINKVYKEFAVDLPLGEIFVTPTVKGLADFIRNSKLEEFNSIKPAEFKEYYPVSSAQKRLYLFNELEGESIGYNMPGAIKMGKELDLDKFVKTINQLVKRHEAFRTSFEIINGEIVQKICESNPIEVEMIELGDRNIDDAINDFIKPFDLRKDLLFRVALIKLRDGSFIGLFDMHHIISDGVSTKILINEFVEIYNGKELHELKIQYKDYSEWKNKMQNNPQLIAQRDYWLNVFKDKVPVLNLPLDYKREERRGSEGETITFQIEKETIDQMHEIAAISGTTLNMITLTAYYALLRLYSADEDIVVGIPVSGRTHPELDSIIGMFVNMLPVRCFPRGTISFSELLLEVKENVIRAQENQDYQYEQLVDDLEDNREAGRNPLFDTCFAYENFEFFKLKDNNLDIGNYDIKNKTAKFDMVVRVTQGENSMNISFDYSTKLFNRVTIEMMGKHYLDILSQMLNNKDLLISEVDIAGDFVDIKKIEIDEGEFVF